MNENNELIDEVTPVDKLLPVQKIPTHVLASKKMRKLFGVRLKPFVIEFPKVGNNSLCPCGSGKKYKKCCKNGLG